MSATFLECCFMNEMLQETRAQQSNVYIEKTMEKQRNLIKNMWRTTTVCLIFHVTGNFQGDRLKTAVHGFTETL